MNTNKELKHSAFGINYYVTKDSTDERPYGIMAELASDCSEQATAENLYFTEAEATACCKWLAENEVYPVTLREVLDNVYSA